MNPQGNDMAFHQKTTSYLPISTVPPEWSHDEPPGRVLLSRRFQHLCGVLCGLDPVEGADDDPVFVDLIGRADRAHCDLAVALLLLPDVVGPDDLQLRVPQQREEQALANSKE